MPIKCLKQGYRHLRLRNTQNQTLELSSLFLYTRQQVEHVEQRLQCNNLTSSAIFTSSNDISSKDLSSSAKAKHKQFKLVIYGLNGDDEENDTGVQVKVTQETTIQQVIEQALAKVDKSVASLFKEKKNYILVQQVDRHWSNSNNSSQLNNIDGTYKSIPKRNGRNSYQHLRTKSLCVFYNTNILSHARSNESKKTVTNVPSSSCNSKLLINQPKDMKILQYHEKIMEAQNKWTGNGKFIIREKSTFLVSLFKKNNNSFFHCIFFNDK